MEQVHGIDVSWMTHGATKDKTAKNDGTRRSSVTSQTREPPPPPPVVSSSSSRTANGSTALSASPNSPKTPSPSRPGFIRSSSAERTGPNGTPLLQRRSSWFSNISSKFSSSSPSQQSPQQAEALPPSQNPAVPKITPARNAVLQHAARVDGDGPYTPAPPRNAGFLGVLRRLSSTSGGGTPGASIKGSHGLVDRVVLNVDQHRERCRIKELNQAKLRRVAFCVDVEIAPMPKYVSPTATKRTDRTQKRTMMERAEAEALKNPDIANAQQDNDDPVQTTGDAVVEETHVEEGPVEKSASSASPEAHRETSAKKKEKKKKNEEERKLRKEKKRQLAEANGSIPMEIRRNSSDSSSSGTPTANGPMKVHGFPTTNPVRIYRRCCQLRESPILKKITEQLGKTPNLGEPGVVERLDITGHYMDLPDLVTIGDYFAVVPVREVILEGCGMTDEGLRVVLSGLLAAKKPECKRRRVSTTDGLTPQGGVVERLVIKNNKIGPEGWRHIALFIYMCRSLKHLDVSEIRFPRPIQRPETPFTSPNGTSKKHPLDCAHLVSKAIGDRLAGSELELLNLGGTALRCDQLGIILDGVIKCGIRRLGLANNNIDTQSLEHIARYLREAKCEGLDLGGNDLREKLEVLGDALTEDHPLWALSLAECNLNPPSLCKLFPKLVKLPDVRFIDLSHNRDLFHWDPSSVGLLRRYLPKMACLKRIHLADVAMTPEQAIQIIEILPEIPHLAHISLLENPRLVSLADAKSEESQEEACALYASLLAATRVSETIICVDINTPRESSSEVVKALAKQVIAYCLRNMERIQVPNLEVSMGGTPPQDSQAETQSQSNPIHNTVPDILLNLVGNDAHVTSEGEDSKAAPDNDYVIGGTGVVKALAVCLKNRGDESRRQSGEFIREVETGTVAPRPKLPPGKAKDMSKHLLISARKIRIRLQPALAKARATKHERHTYQRLLFLDHTLDGMIKRFEDEFPDTKESASGASGASTDDALIMASVPIAPSVEISGAPPTALDELGIMSDDDDTDIRPLSRSNSMISNTSKALVEEEGRTLRTGHKFRQGFLKQEHYDVLGALEELKEDPNHVRMLTEMLDELDDDYLKERAAEIGVVDMFKTEKERAFRLLRDVDPSHWDRFIESQEKAMRNVAPGDISSLKVGDAVIDENVVED